MGWAEIRRVIKTHSLRGWSGHISLMFTGEIHDVSGPKEKEQACVCVCVSVCVVCLLKSGWIVIIFICVCKGKIVYHSRRWNTVSARPCQGMCAQIREEVTQVHHDNEHSAPCRTKSATYNTEVNVNNPN